VDVRHSTSPSPTARKISARLCGRSSFRETGGVSTGYAVAGNRVRSAQ
jgi:hypothetical protein